MTVRVAAARCLAAIAIVVAALAWLQDVPDLSADDAVTAAVGALEDAGLDPEVEPHALRTTYTPRARDPIDVWEVHASVRSEPIALDLAVAGGDPVAIDDRSPDRTTYILSEQEYEEVVHSVEDPARERSIRRNLWFTVAAALAVALAVLHAALAARPKELHR